MSHQHFAIRNSSLRLQLLRPRHTLRQVELVADSTTGRLQIVIFTRPNGVIKRRIRQSSDLWRYVGSRRHALACSANLRMATQGNGNEVLDRLLSSQRSLHADSLSLHHCGFRHGGLRLASWRSACRGRIIQRHSNDVSARRGRADCGGCRCPMSFEFWLRRRHDYPAVISHALNSRRGPRAWRECWRPRCGGRCTAGGSNASYENQI